MTRLLSFLPAATITDLGWTLVHFLWQGLLLALLLEALLPFLRGARARHNFALAALVLMLAAPVVTFFILHTPQAPLPAGGAALTILGGTGVVVDAGTPVAPAPTWSALWSGYLVLAWAAGFVLLSLRALGGWYLAMSLRRREVSALPEELLERCRLLAQRLGVKQAVQFLSSARISVPVVVGWVRPVVLLPLSALAGLPPQQLDALVLHELAHIRRYDAFINILLLAAETVLFYHPAIWWVTRRIRAEREHCCDDLAVTHCGDAVLYVEALTSLESGRVAPGLVLAAKSGALRERAARLLGLPRARARYGWPSIGGVVAAVLLIGTVAMAQSLVVTTRDNPPMGQPLSALPDNAVIHHVMFRGNSAISVKDLTWEIFLRDGVAVTTSQIEKDVGRLGELYRRNGKYFVRIEPRVVPMAESHVELVFNISEGPTVGIAKIAFIGNKSFDAATLKAQLATHESAWYRPLDNDDNYDPDRVMYDRVLLQNFYTGHGHPEVRIPPVEAQLTPDQRNFILTFRIDEDGKQAVVFPPPAALPPSISINVKGVAENNAAGFPIFYQGDVMVRQGDATIRANSVRLQLPPTSRSWSDVTRLVFAGDVTLTSPSGTLRSDALTITVADGRFQVPVASGAVPLRKTEALGIPGEAFAKVDFGLVVTDDKGAAPPINIRADRMTKSTSQDMPVLYQGHALLTQGDVTVRANSIRVEPAPGSPTSGPGQKIGRLVADGDAIFLSGTRAVPGAHLVILVVDHRLVLAEDTLDPGAPAASPTGLRQPVPAGGRVIPIQTQLQPQGTNTRFAIRVIDESASPAGADRLRVSEAGASRDLWLKRDGQIGADALASAAGIVGDRGEPAVDIRLTPKGREQLAALTRANVGHRMAVIVNGRVLTTPTIMEPMPGGKMEMHGVAGSEAEAKALAAEMMGEARAPAPPPVNRPAPATRPTGLQQPAPAAANTGRGLIPIQTQLQPQGGSMKLARLLLPLPPGAPQQAIDNTMRAAMQVRDVTDSCATLERISQDPALRGSVFVNLGDYRLADLDPQLQKSLAGTKSGDVAMPVMLEAGVEILARCE